MCALRPAEEAFRTGFVRGCTTRISVTIATNRDREKHGFNRNSRKSAPKGANGVNREKMCRLKRISGSALGTLTAGRVLKFGRDELYDNFVRAIKNASEGTKPSEALRMKTVTQAMPPLEEIIQSRRHRRPVSSG